MSEEDKKGGSYSGSHIFGGEEYYASAAVPIFPRRRRCQDTRIDFEHSEEGNCVVCERVTQDHGHAEIRSAAVGARRGMFTSELRDTKMS